jgi:hypothetical protein
MMRDRSSGRIRRHALLPVRARFSLLLLAAALLMPAPASSQAGRPYLLISQPEEWRDGRPAIVPAGRSVTIRGVAGHPSGVLRVLVNGDEATMQQDPQYPDLYNFEKVITAGAEPLQVMISIVPRNSERHDRTYSIQPPGGNRALPPPAMPTGGSEQLPNPWSGFRKRGLLYGIAAGGGVVLALRKQSSTSEVCEQTPGGSDCFSRTEEEPATLVPGLALIGGAALGFIIDGMVTSRKAARIRSTGGDDGASARLEPPTLSQRGDRWFLGFAVRF